MSIGVQLPRSWIELAHDAVRRTDALLDLASRQQRPLATVKDAVYAWRQAVLFLSAAGPSEAEAFLNDQSLVAHSPRVMADLIDRLRRVAVGQPVEDGHTPFLDWTVGQHWILDALGRASRLRPA